MRFMLMRKSAPAAQPDAASLAELGRYEQALVRAGVLLAAEHLRPPEPGAAVASGGEELAGFWLIEVKSKEEAAEWARRCPRLAGGDAGIEIRQVLEAEETTHAIPDPVQGR